VSEGGLVARLRTAVVGVGYLGNFHAQKHKTLSAQPELEMELIGVCDHSEAQAKKVAESLGVQAFTSAQDLLGHVDAVTIATITPVHYELAKLFLENGVHVNVEKPMALTSAQAKELVELAQKKGLALAVGHSERFGTIFQKFSAEVKTQKLKWVELSRYAPFNKRGSDVSVLHDLMIHDLDLMLSLDSTKPTLLSAQAGRLLTETYDWCTANFSFASGLCATINISRLGKEMTRQIRAGTDQNLWLANLQTGNLEKTEVDRGTVTVSQTVTAVGRSDNLLLETENFIRHIQTKSPLLVTGQDGLRALEWIEAILEKIDRTT
jgi:predicted dehydrogenase